MAWELILWLLVFVAIILLIWLAFYQFVSLDDLEGDYINPFDSSSRVNACVIPEYLVQGALSFIFLLTWHWFMFLLSAPITYYHLTRYMAGKHLVDVTEIFRFVEGEKRQRLIKIGFYLALFFIVVFRLVLTTVNLLADEDDMYFGSEI